MRKTSYVLTFLAVAVSLTLNILSLQRSDWLVLRTGTILGAQSTIYYGLKEQCTLTTMHVPGGGSGRIDYKNYSCRAFPTRAEDSCDAPDDEIPGRRNFCTEWITASYIADFGIGMGAAAALSIIFGVSTRSRRRRIWRVVAGLVALHAAFKIVVFALVTDSFQNVRFPTFQDTRPNIAYAMNTVSWIADIFIVFAVVTTGIAADAGHEWAAGHRAYRPIDQE